MNNYLFSTVLNSHYMMEIHSLAEIIVFMEIIIHLSVQFKFDVKYILYITPQIPYLYILLLIYQHN